MTVRYTLLLDDDAVRNAEDLQDAWKCKNKAEVYDLAMRVLRWSTEQQANGYDVGRFKDGDFQPLLIPRDFDKKAWIKSQSNGVGAVPA